MRKLFKKSLACLLVAILCATVCIAAIPASAEAITYSTNAVAATPGETVNIDFTVANFSAVKGAMIKLNLPTAIASVDSVLVNGAEIAAYDEEKGTGYYKVGAAGGVQYIKFLSLFGAEFGELASVEGLTFNITATVAADAAEGTYEYPAPVFSVTEDGTTLADVTGAFGKFEVVAAEAPHEHVYIDGICECGEYKYAVDWNDASYNIANTSLSVGYKTTADSAFTTEVITPHKEHSRSIDLCVKLGSSEYVFANKGIGYSFRTIPVEGFTFEDMSAELEVFVRVKYTVDDVTHYVYAAPMVLTIDNLLAGTASGTTYDAYLAYKAAKEKDTANEAIALGSDSTDVVISAAFKAADNSVDITYKASSDSSTPIRQAMSSYPTSGGREVALVISVDGNEFIFHNKGLGLSDRTIPVTGYTFKDLSAECQAYVRVYHYGVNDGYSAYTDSNKVTFTIADNLANGSSDLVSALGSLIGSF